MLQSTTDSWIQAYQNWLADLILVSFEKQRTRLRVIMTEDVAPFYFTEDRRVFHAWVLDLESSGKVKLTWMSKWEKGQTLKWIDANPDHIDWFYEIAQKESIHQVRVRIQQEWEGFVSLFTNAPEWINPLFQSEYERWLQGKAGFDWFVDEEKRTMWQALFCGLTELSQSKDTMQERVFSKRYLGHSKCYEKHCKAKLISWARQHAEMEGDDGAVQEELGIVKWTDDVMMAGDAAFVLHDEHLLTKPWQYGCAIPTRMIQQGTLIGMQATHIRIIENKAVFLQLLPLTSSNQFVIYIGGFPGAVKRRLLSQIQHLREAGHLHARVSFWGDIDWGGFQIFEVIAQIIPDLEAERMDLKTLQMHEAMAERITIAYQKKLVCIKNPQFQDVIAYMIEKQIRLEQEALI